MADKLTIEQKLELFGLATEFEISDEIHIKNKGAKPGSENKDRWAIMRHGFCYSRKSGEWWYEPHSSSRDAVFLKSTRYSLQTALEIVSSPEFSQKYLNGKKVFGG
jgi:hypothetical protein